MVAVPRLILALTAAGALGAALTRLDQQQPALRASAAFALPEAMPALGARRCSSSWREGARKIAG